ncbi:VOC family protein [Gelidibacter salicanalis]|uniref:Extradiol dioxygenase n=1 Tax=Gelidibacter salicanalis TaxID=291193 RepID=A0A934KQD8_9FLAO|nr:VOC family protein [Gelidibacter salicanalis]MBJ7881914.1 extradiol dioxygenase [Gelidibacter salicanalis]
MKSIWINLPVKNIKKSKTFFKMIGFRQNRTYSKVEHFASFFIGENDFVMMLFPQDTFKSFTHNEVSDTLKGTEALLSIDAQNREEVDEMAEKVSNAGGEIFAEPAERDGWMYGFGFMDMDGHRWNMLYMDPPEERAGMDKMPEE